MNGLEKGVSFFHLCYSGLDPEGREIDDRLLFSFLTLDLPGSKRFYETLGPGMTKKM